MVKADSVEPRELPSLWRVYNIFDATTDYPGTFASVLKAVELEGSRQPKPGRVQTREEPGGSKQYWQITKLMNDRQWERALAECDEYISQWPRSGGGSWAWNYMAIALFELGRYNEVLEVCEEMIKGESDEMGTLVQ